MACAICRTRRPRRFCPGVTGEICTLCCGAEREVSVDCPLDCEFLREAHKHEKPQPIDPETLPNRDVAVSEDFLRDHEEFLVFLGSSLARAAVSNPAVVDFDIREALAASIRTFRTLQSGLLYESLPANPLAAGLCHALQDAAAEFRQAEAERLGMHKTGDSAALALLVFLQHFEMSYNNGRRKGRAFLDALLDFYPAEPESEPPASSSLLLP
jgi:hypothetical protein